MTKLRATATSASSGKPSTTTAYQRGATRHASNERRSRLSSAVPPALHDISTAASIGASGERKPTAPGSCTLMRPRLAAAWGITIDHDTAKARRENTATERSERSLLRTY